MNRTEKVLSLDDIALAIWRANERPPNNIINDGLLVVLDEIENVLIENLPAGEVFDCKAFRESCGFS